MTWRLTADYPQLWALGFAILAALAGMMFPHGPGWLFWPGVVVICAGASLMLSASVTMRKHRTTLDPFGQPANLVTSGVFALSRNPIYLGDLLVIGGLCLASGAPLAAILLVPLLMLVIRFRFIDPEEARLEHTFHDEFARYSRQTRRWI